MTASAQGIETNTKQRLTLFLTLSAILLVAALSSSVVSYRTKSVERTRTTALQSHYAALDGDLSAPFVSSEKLSALEPKEATFVAIYELNQLSRAFGVSAALAKVAPENKAIVENALSTLEMKDFFVLNDQKKSDAHPNRSLKLVELALSNYVNGNSR